MRKSRAVIVALALASSAAAAAGSFNTMSFKAVTFNMYREPKDDTERQLHSIYLSGVSDGLLAANGLLQSDGKLRMFFPPPALALTASQAEDVIKRAAQDLPKSDQMPIAVLLVAGLKSKFPCH